MYSDLLKSLKAVTIFKNVLKNKAMSSFMELLALLGDKNSDPYQLIGKYSEFAYELYEEKKSFSDLVLELVTNDENVYVRGCAAGKDMDYLKVPVELELKIFGKVSGVTAPSLTSAIRSKASYAGYLPEYQTNQYDFVEEYENRVANIDKYGYGIYAKYHMFYVKDEKLVPVKHPDPQKLEDLIGYQIERGEVIDNTKALIAGKPAANVLLYGDAGTGKSSTVKAVVNEFKDEGLRIVEIRKEQLWELPTILDELSVIPLKFIIFIDDLSFQKGDDNFGTLKAILEGSVSARSNNVVIYATSNRRHLVKETFSDRDGDDIHRNDTMQETISLSERFGLKVSFGKPNKQCYLEICHALAEKFGIEIYDQFDFEAEAFAMSKGGRSARGARQFIDSLRSK